MHTALEKANSLAENGGGKMSKRKSKNHRKHQQSSQESCTSGPTATVKAAVTTNGTDPDPVKAISKKLEECLHVRENGCTESDLLVVPPRAVVVQQDDDDPIESGKYSHSGNYNTTVTQNGNVDHSASDRSNKIKINKKIESREPSNGAEKKHFAVASSSVTCAAVNGVHSSPESCSQSSQSSSNSSTEQISNKNECQGLGLEKYVAEPNSVPAALTETDSSSGQVNGVVDENAVIEYKEYESELQMQDIMRLIQTELSEPYSIYTYRYFIYNWPKLCFLAAHGDEYVGAIVCKLDMHMNVKRGYIAMLAVKKEYRKMKIGTNLVQKAIEAMLADDADEVVLETEMKNLPALRLYENLGFVRDKRLFRYYLNGVDALRLKLWFR